MLFLEILSKTEAKAKNNRIFQDRLFCRAFIKDSGLSCQKSWRLATLVVPGSKSQFNFMLNHKIDFYFCIFFFVKNTFINIALAKSILWICM